MNELWEISVRPKLNLFVLKILFFVIWFCWSIEQEDLTEQAKIERRQLMQLSGEFERTRETLATGLEEMEGCLWSESGVGANDLQTGKNEIYSLDGRLNRLMDCIHGLEFGYQNRMHTMSSHFLLRLNSFSSSGRCAEAQSRIQRCVPKLEKFSGRFRQRKTGKFEA